MNKLINGINDARKDWVDIHNTENVCETVNNSDVNIKLRGWAKLK